MSAADDYRERVRFNARLVAAAPTMATAIEVAVVNGLDIDGMPGHVAISREHFNDLSAALSKATGERS